MQEKTDDCAVSPTQSPSASKIARHRVLPDSEMQKIRPAPKQSSAVKSYPPCLATASPREV